MMAEHTIYFDNSATTPICETALSRYCEVSRMTFGNPSSLHAVGKEAEDILKAARRTVLSSIGARAGSVVFTSSGTEANNLALGDSTPCRPPRRGLPRRGDPDRRRSAGYGGA